MSDRSQLRTTRRIAVAGFLVAVVSLFYLIHRTYQTEQRVATLERNNAVKDSLGRLNAKRHDSIQDLKSYNKIVQAYDKSANLLFMQNQNLPKSGDQFLNITNKSDSPVRFAVTFLGINKTWFTQGILCLKPKQTTKIWAVDSLSSVYVYVKGNVRINGQNPSDLKAVNLSIDTTTSFIFTGNIPPPHKTAFQAAFHEVNDANGNQIVFSDP